jgi:hypothetical protein
VAEILALDQDDFDECPLKDDIWAAVMATRGESAKSDLSSEGKKPLINQLDLFPSHMSFLGFLSILLLLFLPFSE